ncbi:hypothetical protein [Aurantimonas sp. 22II-16-19i]|uniref:hypothetical protein n=1 Tax=Aurantimonas sp. 22II-16-19i TaxID=1317114 RepID=UPI0009F7E7C9|nr:hypothetical protein [Aurantimonas sp. 22II-16-19i]ORE94861.1 hypothetical protein ATO4_13305 [Aurantimonas sp. 22II-16-19i]
MCRSTRQRHSQFLRQIQRQILRQILRSAPAGLSLLLVGNALAFSQFEGENGRVGPSKDGIIAVPLPPLPGTQRVGPELPPGFAKPSGSPKKDAPEPTDRHRNGAVPASAADRHEMEGTDQGEVPIPPEDETSTESRVQRPANGEADGAPPRPEDAASSPARYQADPAGEPRDGTGSRVGRAFGEDSAASPAAPAQPLAAEIGHDEQTLPAPVRELRTKLIEAARTGDIEAIRPLFQTGEDATVVSFGDPPADPVAFLKSASGDGEGIEILAILIDVLSAGYARVEAGSDDEIFVWPYFTQVDLSRLTKPQLVELFRIVTAGDYQSMIDFGAYNFYRVGITPDGKLQFFVAGD